MSLLASLNERQREAVTHVNGPLLVVAGPGSGKTRVITTRVAHLILDHGVSPHSILAVTFTNKAADEMRERVIDILAEHGRSGMPAPAVSTFHAFCAGVLRRHGEPLAKIRPGFTTGFGICDAADQRSLLKAMLPSLGLDPKEFRVRDLQSAISAHKNNRRSKTSRVRGKNRSTPLAPVLDSYEAQLLAMNALDFDDLLLEAVRLLHHSKAVREELRGRYTHVLVDEYQDTNRAQYQLMKLLVRPRDNVCAVGDEDQSIYAWRGAEAKNVLKFAEDFPAVTTIALEQHYRSTRTILAAASAVISRNLRRHDKRLRTDRPKGELVELHASADASREASFVSDGIAAMLDREPETRIGVFYRVNAQSRQFEEALELRQVPFVVVGAVTFYQRKEVKDILAYLRLAANPEDGVSLRRIINVPARGIGRTTMSRVEAYARSKGLSLWRAIGALNQASRLPRRSRSALGRFQRLVERLQVLLPRHDIRSLVRWVMDSTGYERMLETGRAEDASRLENLRELKVAASEADGRGSSLREFLDRASLLAAADRDPGEARVLLMTLHSAKGLEFPAVFLTGVEEGLIPHSLRDSGSEGEGLEEERRLFYVGMTRAQNRLTLTWAYDRYLYAGNGLTDIRLPSRFLREIPAHLTRDTSAATKPQWSWQADPDPPPKARPPAGPPPASASKTMGALKHFFERQGISTDGLPETLSPPRPARRSPRAAASVPSEDRFAIGSRVRHRKFGIGIVRRREGRGPATKLSVYFRRVGLKRLLARAANLEEM